MGSTSRKITSRKTFIGWAAAILATASITPLFRAGKKAKTKPTATMLTQDGKLVEIDQELLTHAGKKISNSELQNWIKK